jgi:hypothetical protein
MAEETLKDREGRLKLTRLQSEADLRRNEAPAAQLGPPHANEHWKALYERISEVTAGLRR